MPKSCRKWLLHTIAGQVAIVTLSMLACFLAMSLFAWVFQGAWWIGIVAVLGGICYAAAILATVGERIFAARQHAVAGFFCAMIFRTGVPLAAALFMKLHGGPFAELAAFCYLLAFYGLSLAVQVVLAYLAENDGESMQ